LPGSALKVGRAILAGQKSFSKFFAGPGRAKINFGRAFSTLEQILNG